ncbi:uncharacterized protein N7482_007985 [Penicillium canariense]|uniref:Uncharacterized protein n=1 Tax=Penicillium canariense TaxID=189055 RepID=A0A9W9LL32_9EURO|nr:uncharacterized protein N7482_007985 [Penicillium canariense]KAJ5160981.1 hypothetical protein N7482_007985 [Penicillium canariense]
MLTEEDQMSMKYSFIVGAANWSLLAGYLVIPGTFTSLQKSVRVEEALKENETGRSVLRTLQNPPLLAIACFFLAAGFTALAWLLRFQKLRRNYTWLIHKLFTPISLNAAAGLLTTLINVYTSRGGGWSVMAIVTTVVTGFIFVTSSSLLIIYKFCILPEIIRKDNMQEAQIPVNPKNNP